jgi:chorismate--pyruvate lyase
MTVHLHVATHRHGTAAKISHRAEPVWREAMRLHHRDVPANMLRWLLDPASLTLRVRSACSGRFRVDVLSQGWARPHLNEAEVLGMRGNCWGFVREVQLMCDDQPWVFARTIIPRSTLVGANRRLTRLKTRPLGAVLFANPTMTRGPVEIARIASGVRLYASATQHMSTLPAEIWGRRSVFTLSGKPLLVSEIFLPGIPPCP